MWEKCKIVKINKWNNYLFSIKLRANINKFMSGQFTILKLKSNDIYINRFYSYINSPRAKILELYIYKIGKISNILYNIDLNYDQLYVSKKSYGNFLLPSKKINRFNTLWMISSGTAIGPYLSILRNNFKYKNIFKNVKILHSIKYINDFIYLSTIKNIIKKNYNIELFIFLTKENIKKYFNNRITYYLKKNNIKEYFGENIDMYNDHIMICGNISMINDILEIIRNKNINYKNINYKNLLTFEKYY